MFDGLQQEGFAGLLHRHHLLLRGPGADLAASWGSCERHPPLRLRPGQKSSVAAGELHAAQHAACFLLVLLQNGVWFADSSLVRLNRSLKVCFEGCLDCFVCSGGG